MGGKHVNIDSNFKPRKCAKRHHSDDWISQLPDEILAVVLSLLSLKEAARTSVLSSRWLNLWKHTLHLDFEAESSLDKIAEHRELRESERSKYMRWVNSVIESHKGGSTLKDFRICFDLDKYAQEEITKWLDFAFMRQVEGLGLELLEYGDFMKPPPIIYAFPEHLLLVNNLKSLKSLCLKFVDVTDEAVYFFLRNCQFLEKLVVVGADKITNLEACGSSLGLKHLEIRCFRVESIKVSAPNLTTLIVSGVEGLVLENVPMLKEVHTFCGKLCTYKLVPALLGCIQQLEILYLSLCIPKEDIEQWLQCKFPQLPKLKKLVISYSDDGDDTDESLSEEGDDTDESLSEEDDDIDESLMVLTSFIRISPYLQEIVMKISNEENEVKEENKEVKSMRFPHHHLKVFTVEGYIGTRSDVALVKFILENCAMIEKIIIDPRTNKLNCINNKPFHRKVYPHILEQSILREDLARRNAKQLQGLVPQHIKFLIL